MQRSGTSSSMSELQKRYTERAKLRAEERDLIKMIAKTKAQLTQLQVEALDIKSRISNTTQHEAKTKSSQKIQNSVDKGRSEEPSEYEEEEQELELDLSTNNDVLEKMLRGQFSTNDIGDDDLPDIEEDNLLL